MQQEDRERHAERRVGEPHRRGVALQVQVGHHGDRLFEEGHGVVGALAVHQRQRDERYLRRDRQQGDRGDEQQLAVRELDPGEGVRGERGDQDRDDRRRQGDRQRVGERQAHAPVGGAGQHRLVVLQAELVEVAGEHRPPAAVALHVLAAERADEQTERGDQPDHHEQPQHPRGDTAQEPVHRAGGAGPFVGRIGERGEGHRQLRPRCMRRMLM